MNNAKRNSWGRHHRTARGFVLIEFTDLYGNSCTLQDSSLASEEAIWLGVQGNSGEACSSRMHLGREQVAELIPFLQQFVDEGCLPIPPEEREC